MNDMSVGAGTDQKTGLIMAMAYISPHEDNSPGTVADAYDYVKQMVLLRILDTLRESRRQYAVQMHDCRKIKTTSIYSPIPTPEVKAVCSAVVLVVDLSGAAIGEYGLLDMDKQADYVGRMKHVHGYTFQLEYVGWRYEKPWLLWKRVS